MEEKLSFIMEWMAGQSTMTELWDRLDIAHPRLRLYRALLQEGRAGLEEMSRAPRRVWNKTAACVEKLITQLRKNKPRYGPLKHSRAFRGRHRREGGASGFYD